METQLLGELHETMKRHESVNHPIYTEFIEGRKLDRDALLRYSAGYHDMAQGFLEVAATGLLYQGKKDQNAMIAMAQTLQSELGFGDPKQVHHKHFLAFPESQGIPRGEVLRAPPVEASTEYNKRLAELYSGDFDRFLGAQAAFEMDAKEMIHKFHEGARRYTTDPDALVYFHLHLWFEDTHVDWIEEAMKPHLGDEQTEKRVREGFLAELELKRRWLDGLHKHTYGKE